MPRKARKEISKPRLILVALFLAGLAPVVQAQSPSTFPVFSLPDLDGKVWSSAQLYGKPVVLDFWATWCTVCKESIPKLAELSEKHKGKGLVVLHDKENSLGKVFGFNGIPSVYLYDRKGKLSLAMPGYDPDKEGNLALAAEKIL